MKLSIVIPNYNGIKYIKNCIDSIYKQTISNFEIIFVDNCSNDGSVEFILKNYPNIYIISMKENYGFSRAVNEGIKCSKGEYVVLLNNDTKVDIYWLENLVKTIEKDERIFSVCSKMIRYNEQDKIDDAGDEYTLLGWAYKRGDGLPVYKYPSTEEVFSSCAGAAIYRRLILEKIGYFDEKFFAYMEDVDISYRAKIHGYKNIYCAKALVYHIGSATSGSKHNYFKVRLAARNNIYLIYKNMPILQIILNIPLLFIGHLIKYFYFIRKGLGRSYIEGVIEGLVSLKKIKKTKYKHKHFLNYVKIQIQLIMNVFKLIICQIYYKYLT